MNQLYVKLQHSLATLAAKGWSARKIAREPGLHRETVGRYLGLTKLMAKPAIAPAGSKAGRASQCVPFAAVIQQGLSAGLSAQRIYQDLVADHGFTGAHDAVKRFVRRLAQQVDFGQGAWVVENGKRCRTHLFRFFNEVEKPALQPLPAMVFPVFEEDRRMVHRDGHVEFKRACYSVPPEYVGATVWVRQETRLLRVRNRWREQIALHALAEPGKLTTDAAHLHSRKRHIVERGADYLLDR